MPIDATDLRWGATTPRVWSAPYLAAATSLDLHGYRRRIEATKELRWLHGAVTGLLGRGHEKGRNASHQRPDWSLVVTTSGCGWGVVWWDARDGEAVARTLHKTRIGRVECVAELGPAIRIKPPPLYVAGPHPLVVTAVTPVCTKATINRGPMARTVVWRTTPTAKSVCGSLAALAAKLRLPLAKRDLLVEVLDADVHPVKVELGGKLGHREGWVGRVDLVANAPARWLLEVAARGLGLGGSTSYGLGRVIVTVA